jgi:hypothetical protein
MELQHQPGRSPGIGLQYEYQAEKQSHAQGEQPRSPASIFILPGICSICRNSGWLFHVHIFDGNGNVPSVEGAQAGSS